MDPYPQGGCRSVVSGLRRQRLRRIRVRHRGEGFPPLTGFGGSGSIAGGHARGQAAAAKPAGARSNEIWYGRIMTLGYSKVRIKLRLRGDQTVAPVPTPPLVGGAQRRPVSTRLCCQGRSKAGEELTLRNKPKL